MYDVTYDEILERMLSRVSNKFDKREGAVIFDTHSPTALEFQQLYIELNRMIAESYGDSASREFLILLCKDRGITPETATNAVLKGEFIPTDIDVTGRRFNIGTINYYVMSQIAPGEYQVQCETAGTIGNQYLGQMIPMEYIDGLETAKLTEILIPGEDEEETEHLRQRYYASFNDRAFGGNRADYLAKVRGIDGVGDVKLMRVWNKDIRPADMIPGKEVKDWYENILGSLQPEVSKWLTTVYTAAKEKKLVVGGTVLVTVVDALNFGEASEVLIDKIQTALDPEQNAGEGYGLAPIGHIVNVKSAETVNVNITTTLTFDKGFGWENLTQQIREAIETYLLELRKEWADRNYLIVRISQIETRILGIKGIVDITDTMINGVASNFILDQYQIPVLGGVSE